MCRKNHLHGCCFLCFGLGVLVGHSLESWTICTIGGIVLICTGLSILRRR